MNGTSKESSGAVAAAATATAGAAKPSALASIAEESRRNPLAHASCDDNNDNDLDSFQVSSSGSPSQHLLWNNCADYHTLDAGVLHELVTCCTRIAHNMCEVLRMSFYVACVGAAHQHASPEELRSLPPHYLDYGRTIPITQFHATARTVVMNTMDRLVRYMNEQEVDGVVAQLTQMLLTAHDYDDDDEEEDEEEEKKESEGDKAAAVVAAAELSNSHMTTSTTLNTTLSDGPRKTLHTNHHNNNNNNNTIIMNSNGSTTKPQSHVEAAIVVGALAPSHAYRAGTHFTAASTKVGGGKQHNKHNSTKQQQEEEEGSSNGYAVCNNEEEECDEKGNPSSSISISNAALWDEVVPQVDRLVAGVRLPTAVHDMAQVLHANGTAEHTPRTAQRLQRRREQLRQHVRGVLFGSLHHVLQNAAWHTLLHHIILYVMQQFERIVVQRYGLILRLKLMEYYNGTRCELELPASSLIAFQLDHNTSINSNGVFAACESSPRVSLDDILYDVVDEHYQSIMRALDKDYASAGHALTEAAEAWERSVHHALVNNESTAMDYFVQPVTEAAQSVTSNMTAVNAEYSLASHPGNAATTTITAANNNNNTMEGVVTSNSNAVMAGGRTPMPLTAANVQSIGSAASPPTRGGFVGPGAARYAVNTFELAATASNFSPRRESNVAMMASACNGHAYLMNNNNNNTAGSSIYGGNMSARGNGSAGAIVNVAGPLRGMEDSMTEPPSSVLRPVGPLQPSLFMFWSESLTVALSKRLAPVLAHSTITSNKRHDGPDVTTPPLPMHGRNGHTVAGPHPTLDTADTFAFLLGDWAEAALAAHTPRTTTTNTTANTTLSTTTNTSSQSTSTTSCGGEKDEAEKLVHDVRRYESLIRSTAHVALQHYRLIHRSADKLFTGLLMEHCRNALHKGVVHKTSCVCCCAYCLDGCMATLWSSEEPCSSANNNNNNNTAEEEEGKTSGGSRQEAAIPLAASLSMPSVVPSAKRPVSEGSAAKSRSHYAKKMTENSCRCTLM